MMKTIKALIAIFLSVMLAFPPSVLAEAIGTVTYIEGRADRLKSGEERYAPVVIGEDISAGDIIRTKSYSKAEVTFTDNSVLRLGDGSQVKVKEYEVDKDGSRKIGTINVDRGEIRAIVSKTKDKTNFNINTPNAAGSVKGSDIFVSYQKSNTGVLVADGVFTALNPAFPDMAIEIPKGKTSLIPHNAPPQAPRGYLPLEKNNYESATGPKMTKEAKKAATTTQTTVTRIAGDVLVYPSAKKLPHQALINETLKAGDVIETKENGRVQIVLDNGHIIELRANTYFIIKSIARDPKTGAYENLFECKYGKVRAKLQKIKEGSSFKVQTPVAVCGVLGTIMYLEVLPKLTKAFFEGGDGYINNLISNVTRAVFAGMSAVANDQGNITDPTETTDEERFEFGSEWGNENTDDDTYGYSSPEGDAGDDYSDAGFDTGGPGEPWGDGEWFFDDVPQEPQGPTGGGGGTTGPAIEAAFTGNFGYFSSFGVDEDSLLTATLTSVETSVPWTGDAPLSMTVAGAYSNPNERSLWFGDITGTTIDGGALYGGMAGSWHSWEGTLASLYIDPTGVAGILFGYLSGSNDDATGTFTGSGDEIFVIPVAQTEILPEDLAGSVETSSNSSNFSGTIEDGAGYIEGDSDIGYMNITGEPWGIWRAAYGAEYDRPEDLDEWLGVSGGSYGEGESYFIAIDEGIDDLDGALRIDTLGTFITQYELGAYFGTILGTYQPSESFYFEGVGIGGWEKAPLAFVSEVNSNLYNSTIYNYGTYYFYNPNYGYYDFNYYADNSWGYSYTYTSYPYSYNYIYYYSDGTTYLQGYNSSSGYYSYYGDPWDTDISLGDIVDVLPDGYSYGYQNSYPTFNSTGEISGLLGGTESLWPGPASYIFMGEFSDYGAARAHIWLNNIYSYNYLDETYTTYDGGAYYGYIGGTHHNPIEGRIIALYIDPNGNAGYLKSDDLLGESFDEIGMFAASGTLTPTQVVSGIGIAPEDLYDSIWESERDDADLSGEFLTGGSINAEDEFGAASIVDFANGIAQNWGIYNQRIVGEFSNPENDTEFSAVMGGNDAFGAYNPELIHSGYYYGYNPYYESYSYEYNDGQTRGYRSYYLDSPYSYETTHYYEDGSTYTYGRTTSGSDYSYNDEWDVESGLSFLTTPSEDFSWQYSGTDNYGTARNDYGYWIADIDGSDTWADGKITALLNGTFLTYTKMGEINGEILGNYNDDSEAWQAVGLGTWQGTPLTFSGRWGNEDTSIYQYNGDYLSNVGEDYGLIGATTQSWWDADSFEVLAMGRYNIDNNEDNDEEGENGLSSYIWNTPILSYNAPKENDTTLDNGAFYGYTAGLWSDESLEGSLMALYIDPDGNAGYLSGNISGTVYPGIEMWQASGILQTDFVEASGISPEDFYDSIWRGENDRGELSGEFDTGGYINGEDYLNTASLVDYENAIAYPWGIYSQRIYGEFYNPENDTEFSAVMGGNDAFGAYNPYTYRYGQYNYEDGYYNYNYYTNNSSGYVEYYRLDENINYYINYNSDGTYNGYDYYEGEPIEGTWSGPLSEIIGTTPPDSENARLNYEYSDNNASNDNGYWIADIDGSDTWENGILDATLNGTFLTHTKMGEITGEILGNYNDDSEAWQAVGLGRWQGESLSFSGYWGGEGSLYYNDGYPQYAGEDYGLVGSTTESWWNQDSFPMLAMGQYYSWYSEPYIWNTETYSYNVMDDEYTTLDNGAFRGYTGGIWNNETLDGALAAIYMDPDGNAGILRGPISGAYYPDIEMWKAEALITPTQLALAEDINIDPEDLYWQISSGNLNADVSGAFTTDEENESYIEGWSYGWGNTYFIVDYDWQESQPWGIFDLKIAGSDTYYNPDYLTTYTANIGGDGYFGYNGSDWGYWLADIDGTAQNSWSNNEIRGNLSGTFLTYTHLGAIEGDVFGTYDEYYDEYYDEDLDEWILEPTGYGNFIAESLGSWQGEPLTFSAQIDAAYHYYDDGSDYIDYYNQHSGILGSTLLTFGNSETEADLTLIGETYPYGYITWWGYLYGSRVGETVIPDGFIAGRTNSIEGMLVSLYIDESGNAGILSGDFSGDYYEGLDMWKATGAITATPKTTGYSTDRYNSSYDYIYGYFHGDFNGAGEIYNDYNIYDISYGYFGSYTSWLINPSGVDEPWGIYNIELGGYYDGPISDNWTLYLGGDYWRGLEEDEYWLATITGSQWSNQRIAGILDGTYLTNTVLGSINGKVLGSYDTEDYDLWEAIALGTFEETPLTFSGLWGENEGTLYYNDGGNPQTAGYDNGLIGSTVSEWWSQESFPMIAMGQYDNSYSEPYIWNTTINSYNAIEYDGTTLDGGAFFGYTGGIWNNETLDGALAAIYMDPDGNAGVLRGDISGSYYPELEMWMAGSLISPTVMTTGLNSDSTELESESGFKADVSGGFATGDSFIDGKTKSGETSFLHDNPASSDSLPWGIYEIIFGASPPRNEYENPDNSKIWLASLENGDGYFGHYRVGGNYHRDDRGSWIGQMGGVWQNSEIEGRLYGIYITDENKAGIIKGDVFGVYDETDSLNHEGAWIGESIGTFIEMGNTEIDRRDLEDYIDYIDIQGTGSGRFSNDNVIDISSVEGAALHISDQNWGIWTTILEGTYQTPLDTSWQAVYGASTEDAVFMGTIDGSDWSSGRLSGINKGYFWRPPDPGPLNGNGEEPDTLIAGITTGEIIGTYEVEGEDWQAVGLGEWVELAELATDVLGFDMDALNNFVSIPITEVYSDLLAGSNGVMSATMDISFFADASNALQGIWASLINGAYTEAPGDNWTLDLNSENFTATLSEGTWLDNEWTAIVVDGTGPGGVEFGGAAGGTYNDAGAFTGVGAGTWETAAPIPE